MKSIYEVFLIPFITSIADIELALTITVDRKSKCKHNLNYAQPILISCVVYEYINCSCTDSHNDVFYGTKQSATDSRDQTAYHIDDAAMMNQMIRAHRCYKQDIPNYYGPIEKSRERLVCVLYKYVV